MDSKWIKTNSPILRRLRWAEPEIRRQFQKEGVNILPVNFYSNTPSLEEIDASFEYNQSETPPYLNDALFNKEIQKNTLENITVFSPEFNPPVDGNKETPIGYFWKNGQFGYSDAMAYYCFIRYLCPNTILEIGSGFSTLVAIEEVSKNNKGTIHCVEPYPRSFLIGNQQIVLHKRTAQSLDDKFINEILKDGDILFIDSTHTVKSGSDCLHIYLRLLPKIRHNIYIHVHDIFLPYGVPKHWLTDMQIFWTEQYLLMAFLLDNPKAHVLFGSRYAAETIRGEMIDFMGGKASIGGGSLWFSYDGRKSASGT